MELRDSHDLGAAIRDQRKRLGYRQEQLAAAAGVGARFVVDLEQGKPTAQLGKALAVARAVGLRITASTAQDAADPDV